MPKIKGLSHVVLYVNDLEKMAAFYRDVLGLVRYRERPGHMIFMTPDPEVEDHQLALAKGREGEAKIIAHNASRGGEGPSPGVDKGAEGQSQNYRSHRLARRDARRRQRLLRTMQGDGSAD